MASFKDDPDYLGPISATPQKMVEEMLAVAGAVSYTHLTLPTILRV